MGVLSVNWVARSQRRTTVLSITSPVWPRLRIHAATGVRVAVCHVWVGRIGGMLPVGRVGWARSGDGRIYRNIVVRFDRMGLMATPIMLGH